MTRIMHETYGYNKVGISRFAINRILRIYPPYLAAVLITLAILHFSGEDLARVYSENMFIPSEASSWLANFTLVHPRINLFGIQPLVVPPSWALTIELCFYAFIGVGIACTRSMTVGWFLSSIIVTALLIWLSRAALSYDLWSWIYFSVFSGSLPFSIGALIYHYSPQPVVKAPFQAFLVILACGSMFIGSVALFFISNRLIGSVPLTLVSFYSNMAIQAAVVTWLASIKIQGRPAALDKAIGEYSYLIYLLHMAVAVLISRVLFDGAGPGHSLAAIYSFMITMISVICIGYVIIHSLIEPLEKVRSKARARPA